MGTGLGLKTRHHGFILAIAGAGRLSRLCSNANRATHPILTPPFSGPTVAGPASSMQCHGGLGWAPPRRREVGRISEHWSRLRACLGVFVPVDCSTKWRGFCEVPRACDGSDCRLASRYAATAPLGPSFPLTASLGFPRCRWVRLSLIRRLFLRCRCSWMLWAGLHERLARQLWRKV